ncbi:MAG TPA: serine/threonine-protein kinase [Solirubrobacterales bacterium]|nr:serine/threonine-protein kinase [Solirubrobacterales bacterium]
MLLLLMTMGEYASWEFEEGAELHPGRIVLKPIGGGNRYEVVLVWDESLYALGVAKVLRPDQASDEKALRDLGREVEALRALAHPTLVRSFDAVLDGPRPHVLIEHLEGPSLRRLIKRDGAIPLEQLLPLAAHVAGALQYMAQAGYVHLDVKPDNIVMGLPPRLLDLSIARTLERAGRTDGPLGTDPYMAPEQCVPREQAAAPIGPATDVWGLGATLFHAISGEKPFPRGSEDEGVERFPQLVEDPLPLPEWIPAELSGLILETLERDPAKRPSCAQLVERLQPLVAALPRKMTLARRGALR